MRSFDELLEFLLDGIALKGGRGASTSDFESSVRKFYEEDGTASDLSSSGSNRIVDRKFIEQAWEWLAAHPDIWIGQNREGNKMSLSEAEALESTAFPSVVNDGPTLPSTTTNANSNSTITNLSRAQVTETTQPGMAIRTGLRIYTTQSRIWQALTGHGIDFKRVLAMEFQLLLIIAAAGPLGITQPDLSKASGQDKRSVPKRTEELHRKGYIVKKLVYEKGTKTSLLVLKRYISRSSNSGGSSEQAVVSVDSDVKSSVFVDGRLILDHFLDFLVTALGNSAVPVDNLILDLGVKNKKWERTMIHRCLDRLDIIGVISRFRALVKVSADEKKRVRSVKLLHKPMEADRQRYHALTNQLRAKFRENLEAQDAIRHGTEDASSDHDQQDDGLDTSSILATDLAMEDALHEPILSADPPTVDASNGIPSKRILAQWNPDLPYPNILFNTIHSAGPNGLPSMDATAQTYGDFYSRSVDGMLGRMTDDWEYSQPKYLMHLALIRDTAVENRTNHYLYRSYLNFQKAVESGDADWDAVRTGKGKRTASPDLKLDQSGFPVIPARELLGADGSASLTDATRAARRDQPQEKEKHDGEPVLQEDRSGNDIIVWPRPYHGRKRKRADSEGITPFSPVSDVIPSGTASRPAHASPPQPSGQFETPKPIKKYVYPRPETVKGMTWSEYNRQYREKRMQEKFAEKRMERIRRHAEWIVDQEEKSGHEQDQSSPVANVIHAPMEEPPEVTTPTPSKGKKRGRPTREESARKKQKIQAERDTADLVTPIHSYTNTSSRPQRANAVHKRQRQDRIEQLVTELSDISRTGLHLDPPGSRPHVGGGSIGKAPIGRQRQVLVAVFKFPWLKDLEWFVRNSGTHYVPKEQSATTSHRHANEETLDSQAASAQLMAETSAAEQRASASITKGQTSRQSVSENAATHIQPTQDTAAPNSDNTPSTNEWLIGFPENFELIVLGKETSLDRRELRTIARNPCSAPKKPSRARKKNAQHGRAFKRRKAKSWKLDIQELENAELDLPESRQCNGNVALQPLEDDNSPTGPGAEAQQPTRDVRTEISVSVIQVEGTDVAGLGGANTVSEDTANVESALLEKEQESNSYAIREQAGDPRARRKRGVGLGGGSIRAKRINIILDIVNKCGGVFGGDTEIIRAFQDAQMPDNKDSEKDGGKTPVTDRDTILKAVKAAVSDGKVKRVAWAFTDQNGFAVTKKLLLRPDVRLDDPVAIEFRKKIEETYPVQYIPEFLLKRKRGGIEKPQAKVISRYLDLAEQENELGEEAEAQWITDHRQRQQEMEKRRDERRLQRMRDWWHGNKHQLPKTPRGRLKKLVRQQTLEIAATLPREEIDAPRTKRKYTKAVDTIANEIARYEAEAENIPGALALDLSGPPRDTTQGQTLAEILRTSSYQTPVPSLQLMHWIEEPPQIYLAPTSAVAETVVQTAQASGPRRMLAPKSRNYSEQQPLKIAFAETAVHGQVVPKVQHLRFESLFMKALFKPTQRLHRPTGTYATSFVPSYDPQPWSTASKLYNVSANTTAKSSRRKSIGNRNYPHVSSVLGGRQSTVAIPTSTLEGAVSDLSAWRKEGYNMCLLRSGLTAPGAFEVQDGFINYSANHPQVTVASLNQINEIHSAYRPGDHFTIYGAPNQAPPTGVVLGPVPDPLQIRGLRSPFDPYAPATTPDLQRHPASLKRATLTAPVESRAAASPSNNAQPRIPKSKLKKSPRNRNAKPVRGDPTCIITPATAKKLLFGVIVVRALTGGPTQTIHWHIIDALFNGYPNFDETAFRKRWGIMQQYHREVVERVEAAFQNAFLAAYEKDEVPRLNNENPEKYDWEGIVKWAGENVMIDSRDIGLPASYEEFERHFVIQDEDRAEGEATLRESMFKEMSTVVLRGSVTSELEFSMPLPSSTAKGGRKMGSGELGSKEMELAKSWARASIATSNDQYNPESALAKLGTLGDSLLSRAIQELQEEKIIVQSYKGRPKLTGGRNYHLAEHYNTSYPKKCIFIRQLLREHFVEAIAFKKTLDAVFAAENEEDRVYVVPDLASDGEILCITELMAHERIRIIPRLPPRSNEIGQPWPRISVWGLGKELNYSGGKHVDPKFIRWSVEIRPTESYVSGFPISDALEKVESPMTPKGDEKGMERVPYWVDIHGNFSRENWENVILAVVHLIAVRAGSTIAVLQKSFRGLIWDWEIEMAVDWLIEVGVARWIGDEVEMRRQEKRSVGAKEWWWSVLTHSL